MPLIKFNRGSTPYLPGETAMFDDVKAAAFVSGGRAEYVTKPIAAETPALPAVTKNGDGDPPDLPADWRDLHHATQVKLAKQFDESVSTKAEAIVVLEAAEKTAQA